MVRGQGKIENANRVINGVCRAMWLSLENLLREKLPSDSILIAWLIRHAAWCLTRFQVKNDGITCVCACFWESVHEPSVAIRRKSGVQVHIRENKQSGSEMGPWNLGWQGANDRRTHHSHGKWVQKARSLHRVPPEERFVISELRNVRGLPWNGRAENLKATTNRTKAHLDIDD